MATPTPTTLTMQQDSDVNVLANLQTLGTSVQVTGYSSVSGKQVTFSDTPSQDDINLIEWYFQTGNDMLLMP